MMNPEDVAAARARLTAAEVVDIIEAQHQDGGDGRCGSCAEQKCPCETAAVIAAYRSQQ